MRSPGKRDVPGGRSTARCSSRPAAKSRTGALGRGLQWALVAALIASAACSRHSPPAVTFFGKLTPGVNHRAVLAQLSGHQTLEFAGATGQVTVTSGPDGQLRELSWDVRHTTSTCEKLVPAVEASLRPDFGMLGPFPKWTVYLPGVRRTCEGNAEDSRAIRLCCAEIGETTSRTTLLSVTLAFRDTHGTPSLSEPRPPPPPPVMLPPWRDPGALPAIPTAGLPPVELGACRRCPPARERIASPVVLEINRNPCGLGICPGYQIRAHRDGTVEFMGRENVRAPSYCVARIDAKRLDRILEAAAALEHVPPGGYSDDSDGVVVTARLGSKQVTRRSDNEGDPLFPLAAQLEAAFELSSWSEPPPTAPRGRSPLTGCHQLPERWTYPESTTLR